MTTTTPAQHLAPEVAAEIAGIVREEVRGELRHEERLRHVENQLSAIQATLAANSRPPFWPQVVGSVLGIGGALIAVITLVFTTTH